jgi:hypothetical protein
MCADGIADVMGWRCEGETAGPPRKAVSAKPRGGNRGTQAEACASETASRKVSATFKRKARPASAWGWRKADVAKQERAGAGAKFGERTKMAA